MERTLNGLNITSEAIGLELLNPASGFREYISGIKNNDPITVGFNANIPDIVNQMMISQIQQDIAATILADATLTSMIETRVFPQHAIQPVVFPYLIFSAVSILPDYELDRPSGLYTQRFQFDAFDKATPEESGKARAVAIVQRVVELFHGIRQVLNGRTSVEHALLEDLREDVDKLGRDNEPVFQETVDLTFIYNLNPS